MYKFTAGACYFDSSGALIVLGDPTGHVNIYSLKNLSMIQDYRAHIVSFYIFQNMKIDFLNRVYLDSECSQIKNTSRLCPSERIELSASTILRLQKLRSSSSKMRKLLHQLLLVRMEITFSLQLLIMSFSAGM